MSIQRWARIKIKYLHRARVKKFNSKWKEKELLINIAQSDYRGVNLLATDRYR